MEIRTETLEGEDVRDFVRVFWAAFEPLEADMIMPMIYPNGLQPDALERLSSGIGSNSKKGGDTTYIIARENGKMIGVSSWSTVLKPYQSQEEIDAAFEDVMRSHEQGKAVKGMNMPLSLARLRASFYSEAKGILKNGGGPHVVLQILAVHPDHHRKGIASKILSKGLAELADAKGLPTYLDCGVQGKPVYERFGFQLIADFPLDARQYGGRSQGKHWCMVRPGQGR